MKQHLKLLICVVAALVGTACSSGGISGDSNDSNETTAPTANSTSDDPTSGSQSNASADELGERLVTRFVSADDFDTWLCSSTDNHSFLYGFFDSLKGVEIDVTGDIAQSFEWTVVGAGEVRLKYPETDTQVDLTNIAFSSDRAFTAHSSQRSVLSCTLEVVLEDDSTETINPEPSAGSDAAALNERVATKWTDDSAFDIWLCSTESDGVGYVFTLAGAITEEQLAVESSTQAGETVTVLSVWRATDGNTLELTQEDGAVVTIGNIEFDNDESFGGNNSKFGRMACTLKSIAG